MKKNRTQMNRKLHHIAGEANVLVVCLLQLAESQITCRIQFVWKVQYMIRKHTMNSLRKKKIIQTQRKKRNQKRCNCFSLCLQQSKKLEYHSKEHEETNVSIACLVQLAESVKTWKSQIVLEGLVHKQENFPE